MNSLMVFLLGLAAGAVVGAVLGWIVGRGRAGAARPEEALTGELRQQVAQREAELTDLRSRQAQTGADLAAARANQAATERLLAEQQRRHDEQLLAWRRTQDQAIADLRETFKALSTDALRQTQPEFLRLATETLGRFQETAKGDLAQRQQAIATLVEPLKQQLDTYQQRLQQSESAQALTLGDVRKHLETLTQQSQSLSNETLQLRRVLSSNQARGRWGEATLRRVVEAAGMSAHCDFSEQTQAGDAKPDMVVRLPGDRVILVDAKVPDLDFIQTLEAADPVKRGEALAAHAGKLKATIKALADRDYPHQFPNALDYVVLFLPAESLFSAALEGDRDLIVWAAGRRILLATPASLIALLRSVSVSWQQHAQTENARAIAEAASELFNRVCRFTEHLEKIRAGLAKAQEAFNDAVGSYDRMVRPSGDRLAKLRGAMEDKRLADLAPIEGSLRLPPAASDPPTP
jgi:DNA recombination protein RmuC